MSMNHDGKVHKDYTAPEAIEKAYLDAISADVPDLWSRIEAGLDAPAGEADNSFRELMQKSSEEVADASAKLEAAGDVTGSDVESVPDVAEEGSEPGSSEGTVPNLSVVPDINTEKSEPGSSEGTVPNLSVVSDTGSSGYTGSGFASSGNSGYGSDSSSGGYQSVGTTGSKRAMRRVWGGLLVAAALIIIISVPFSRFILSNSGTSRSESARKGSDSAEATTGAYEYAATEAAAEAEEYEEYAMEEEAGSDNSIAAGAGETSKGSDYEMAGETQAATEASAENITEATTTADIQEAIEDIDNLNMDDKKYKIRIVDGGKLIDVNKQNLNISGTVYFEDGEYLIKDWLFTEIDGETKDIILVIDNPDDCMIADYYNENVSDSESGVEVQLVIKNTMKKAEKSEKIEVEVVEIR